MKQRYIQECTNCGNVVVGQEKRGFLRDALRGGPGTAVEFIPVGGKLIWKASKEIVLRLLRTDMEKWGDELEKWIYKDIQVEYQCPKCGKTWTETHPLSESEYKQMLNDFIEQAKAIIFRKSARSEKLADSDSKIALTNLQVNNNRYMRLQIPYPELEQMLSKNLQQKQVSQIRLAYADESTIHVSAVVKMIISKDVDVNVSVKEVDDSGVTLTYQAGMAIELMAKGFLKWHEDDVKDMLEEQDNNTLLVHLDKIDKLKTVLEKVVIQSISFEPDYINLCFVLK